MNLAKKFSALAKNPALGVAWLRWMIAKAALGKSPTLKFHDNVKLGGWFSFSEFWSFREGVPHSERAFFKRCMQSGKGRVIAFDVGANIGAFNCLFAACGASQIHAFEAIPETFCRLKANVLRNGMADRCRLNCFALGKRQEILTFRIEPKSPAENQLAASTDSTAQGSVENLQSVASTSLNAYCQSAGIEQIDFLKIDVEGMEPYVLQGAKELLRSRKIAAILIEICPVNLRAVGLSPAGLYREFETARYSPYALNEDGRPGMKLSLAEIELMSLANVILLPDV